MNKYLFPLVALLFSLAISHQVTAQIKLPQVSPEALVRQTIGLTEISVRYHAPGVKGRQVFGSLVPYGKLWRAGANEATLITFEDDLFLNHERVPAGTYSFFILPENETDWNIVLNKDTTLWGLEGYNELNDVAYLRVTPKQIPFQETLQFSFGEISSNTGTLNLSWEKSQVSIRIETEVEKKALANIQKALKEAAPDDWYTWAQAANYLLDRRDQHEKALEYINKSITIKDNFYNNWVKARLYALNREYQVASTLCAKAIKLGNEEPQAYRTYAQEIETAHKDWKKRKY